ncbi:ATP-binding protein [Nocardioides aestuarii]|uniref:ATP-binding protein n=1 Tax=Nocardioides aestuarii TaxID=252231 RepID=A0ABW4TP54_9ACTN
MQLLERGSELERLDAAVEQAAAGGPGAGFAISGDSGAGKSAVVAATCETATRLRVLRGHCDPLLTPRPLGPVRDLFDSAGRALLAQQGALLSEVCEAAYDLARTEPTLLVVEDLHWVDAASVEVLRFLVRRVEAMPVVLVMTYRDLEIGPGHPARSLLGDVAALEGVTPLALSPLSVDAVRQLVAHTSLDAALVHDVTGGNPFFVTEVAKEPHRPMPASVRDAVLARTHEIPASDFEILQLVASAPDHVDDRVLPRLGVDLPSLRRLDETGLLNRAAEGIVFRHELARLAIESTIPVGGAARLHARLLEALEGLEPRNPAVLTHHAVAAHDAPKASAYARQAAAEAISAGAHGEAAAFFEIALQHLGAEPPAERAQLLVDLAFQQYMTGQLPKAIRNVEATFPLWAQANDLAGEARAHAAVAIYEYYNARRRHADLHLDAASTIAQDAGDALTFRHARISAAYLAYMSSDDSAVTDHMALATAPGIDDGQDLLRLRRRLIEDVTDLSAGREEARDRILDDVDDSRRQGFDELASTLYSQLSYLDVEQGRLTAAERLLDQSLPFTVERDIPICRQWQTGVRSRLHLGKGRWNAALEDAETVLGTEGGMQVALLWPFVVTALVPLRRGQGFPREQLERAWTLADSLDEPLRRLAVLAALAEVAWMIGEEDPRVHDLAPRGLTDLSRPATAWSSAALATWLRRLGLPVEMPADAPTPFRLAIEGRHAEAASWWHTAGDSFQEAMTLSDSPDAQHRLAAVAVLDRLGAVGTADRLRAQLRAEGVGAVPQRPREATRANPGGLTNRQLDVARLVARGLSNSEIAAALYISPKTADHHVSAILGKLGLESRRAVARKAEQLGLK